MQLTIDTKHDSPEEIKKAIKMLMSLTGEVYTNDATLEQPQKNVFDSPETDMGGMMSLFDNNEQKDTEPEPKTEFY